MKNWLKEKKGYALILTILQVIFKILANSTTDTGGTARFLGFLTGTLITSLIISYLILAIIEIPKYLFFSRSP